MGLQKTFNDSRQEKATIFASQQIIAIHKSSLHILFQGNLIIFTCFKLSGFLILRGISLGFGIGVPPIIILEDSKGGSCSGGGSSDDLKRTETRGLTALSCRAE